MQYTYEEKRQHPRINLAVCLRYQIRGSQEFGNTLTKNISIGGLSFIVDKFIKPQTRMLLDVNILSRTISALGTVRWAGNLPHSDKYQIGLEFSEMTPDNKNYISDFINMRSYK